MASVRQIAAHAGISVATVSRALNDKPNVSPLTRNRVLASARALGYQQQQLVTISDTIALAYPQEIVHSEYGAFDAALLSGVLKGLGAHRVDLIILSIERDKRPEESYASFFRRKGVGGVILRSFDNSRQVAERITEERFPMIVVADRFENSTVNFVCTCSFEDSQRAVEHLVHLGHKRIGLGIHHVRDTDHRDRFEGYKTALEDHGLEYDPSLVVDIVADIRGGASCVRHLIGLSSPPSAVFFTDPTATLGAIHGCHELGIRVPEDLSLIGFDDSDVRYHASPPFTAVCQDAGQLGFEATQWLIKRISGETREPLQHVRPTRFEINQTTSSPSGRLSRIVRNSDGEDERNLDDAAG